MGTSNAVCSPGPSWMRFASGKCSDGCGENSGSNAPGVELMLRTVHVNTNPRKMPPPLISSFHASDMLQSVVVAVTRSQTKVARMLPPASRAVTTTLRSRSVSHSDLNVTCAVRDSPALSVSEAGATSPASGGSSRLSLHKTACADSFATTMSYALAVPGSRYHLPDGSAALMTRLELMLLSYVLSISTWDGAYSTDARAKIKGVASQG